MDEDKEIINLKTGALLPNIIEKNKGDLQADLDSVDLEDLIGSGIDFADQYQQPISFTDVLKRREELKNDDISQDIRFKNLTLKSLLRLLLAESAILFLFAFLQGMKWTGFSLSEWSFRILVGSTLTQVYLMLRIIVQYLFPNHK